MQGSEVIAALQNPRNAFRVTRLAALMRSRSGDASDYINHIPLVIDAANALRSSPNILLQIRFIKKRLADLHRSVDKDSILKPQENEWEAHIKSELIGLCEEFGEDTKINTDIGLVEVTIGDIELHDEKGSPHRLSDMVVSFNLNDSTITVEPKNTNNDSTDGYFHPHVDQEGEPCFGTAWEPIKEAIKNGNLIDVFLIMERLLRSYNSQSPFQKLSEWSTYGVCNDCGAEIEEEENRVWCKDCEAIICRNCSTRCEACNAYLCESCTHTCETCGSTSCFNHSKCC